MFALVQNSDNQVLALSAETPTHDGTAWQCNGTRYGFLTAYTDARAQTAPAGCAIGDTLQSNGGLIKAEQHPVVLPTTATRGPRRLTKLAFVGCLGDAFPVILAASKQNIELEMFVRMLDWATPDPDGTSVDLDDPRVVYALNQIEAAGLQPAGWAANILA